MTRRNPTNAILPMTPTATPISATTKQQHQKNNDENQFHSKSPLRSRLQMEGTGRCALSSARPEFRYRPSRRRRIKEATTKAALLPPTHSRSERLSGPGKLVAGGEKTRRVRLRRETSSRTPYPVTQPRPNRPRITSHTSNIPIPQALLCPAAWQRRSRQLRSLGDPGRPHPGLPSKRAILRVTQPKPQHQSRSALPSA